MPKPKLPAADRPILTSGEVAVMFGVHMRTIHRWTDAGLLPFFTTLGGHRRFYRDAVEQAMARVTHEDRP